MSALTGSISLEPMGIFGRRKPATTPPRPPAIALARERGVPWHDQAKVAAKVRALRALGFRLIGSHRVMNVDSLRLVALGHPEDGFAAVVYEHDEIGPWVELVALYRPGGSLTVSDLALPDASSSSHLRLGMPGAKPRELLATLRQNVSGYETLRYFNPHNFRTAFEDLYARQRKALNETGEVDVAAVLHEAKSQGGRVWKVALVGCATLVVVGLVVGGLGFSWLSSKFLELGEDIDQAMAEGAAFAAGTDQRGCLDETLRRTSEDDVVAAMQNMMFLDACLATSVASTPPLCEGAPTSSEMTAAAEWSTARCAEYDREADVACTTLVATVLNFCEFGSSTFFPQGEELPAGESEGPP